MDNDPDLTEKNGDDSAEIKVATERQDIEQASRQTEARLAMERPDTVGLNFDHEFITDSRSLWREHEWECFLIERDGGLPTEYQAGKESGLVRVTINDFMAADEKRRAAFERYVLPMAGKLQNVRIHPYAEMSPLAPSQAVIEHYWGSPENGEKKVHISDVFREQMTFLKEKCPDLDLTLVVPFYDHRRGKEQCSNVPETPEQVEQYTLICEQLIVSLGPDIQIEIGNETNVTRLTDQSDEKRFDQSQFSTESSPETYGKFYYQVAKRLKAKAPTVRLSIAGTACFDPGYVEAVLKIIQDEQTNDQSEDRPTVNLVDTVSWHPYRNTPEGGSPVIVEGSITKGGQSELVSLSYEQQLDMMKKIAEQYGASLTVGEVNFPITDPDHEMKLTEAVSVDNGVKSYIYPASFSWK